MNNPTTESGEGTTSQGALQRLVGQFPALRSLGESLRKREIPVIRQAMATDCGAACLSMVLGFHGSHVPLDQLRTELGVGRDGVSARMIVDGATTHGLRARGVKIDIADLEHLPTASVLHWNFKHFVVYESRTDKVITIVDPQFGRREVTLEDAGKSMTGVALIFEKSDTFAPVAEKDNVILRHLGNAVGASEDWGRIALMSILLQVVTLILPIINGRLIDRVVPRNDHHLLTVLLAGLATTVVFNMCAATTRGQLLLQLRTRFDAKMTFGFIDHLLRLPYEFFERRQPADLQMRVGSVSAIRETLTGAVLSGAIDGVMVVSQLALLCIFSPKMACTALVIVVVQGTVYVLRRRKMQELAATGIAKQAEAANALNELLHGMESLKASGNEQRASQGWATKYVETMNVGLRQASIGVVPTALLSTLCVTGPMILLITGVMEVMDGRMTLGTMLSANALAVGFVSPMMNLIATFQQLQFTRVHLDRIDDVLTAPVEQENGAGLMAAPKLSGEVTLENVSFRYGPKLQMVVKQVSVSVRPGEFIAIVGRSGSGKTTLGRLLLGLYQPTDGDGVVRFDGLPLPQLEIHSVRRQLGVVTQRPHIFGTTIRANISLANPDLTLDEVREAARKACILSDVQQMPLQFETPVVAGGASLSGGQRQRIALARALVNDPAVLLLDEATSALDAMTESALQRELAQLRCTRIFIAHRLSTVVNADRILVMEKGELVEQGTHDELIALGGVYAELVSAQMSDHVPMRGAVAQKKSPPSALPPRAKSPPLPAPVARPRSAPIVRPKSAVLVPLARREELSKVSAAAGGMFREPPTVSLHGPMPAPHDDDSTLSWRRSR